MRKILALIAVVAASLTFSGCAPATQAQQIDQLTPTCKPFTEGKAMDSLKASDDLTKAPNATFTNGLTSTQIETKIIKMGTGPKLVGNQLITMEYEGLNGGTGKIFQTSKHDGTDSSQLYLQPSSKPDFCHPLTGVRVGSRVAILFPAADAHGGAGVPSLGVGATDSIVFVLDVVDAALPHAVGATGAPQNGFPAISIDPATGAPGFTFAKAEAPTELKTEKLIIGNGEKVKEGDTVTLNYSGIVYGGQTTFDSSWEQGQPAQFTLTKGGLIDGFYQTLVGASVGDRIVTIIPPALGYGENTTSTIPANSTLVFVIEILATKHN